MERITSLTQSGLTRIVQAQLALDLNCAAEDLSGPQDNFIFVEAGDNPGRRPFPRNASHFEMLSMGAAVVVSATPDILARIRPLFTGITRDAAFSLSFVYGIGLYYLPDLAVLGPLAPPEGFTFQLAERESIPALYRHVGYHNALQYDIGHPRPDVLAAVAYRDGEAAGMAGASADCAGMWQVGIDVLPAYRRQGLAAYLVNCLTLAILRRGIVPYYGTSSSNLASQRVAHRAGYIPAWVCAYRGRFDGIAVAPTG